MALEPCIKKLRFDLKMPALETEIRRETDQIIMTKMGIKVSVFLPYSELPLPYSLFLLATIPDHRVWTNELFISAPARLIAYILGTP